MVWYETGPSVIDQQQMGEVFKTCNPKAQDDLIL